MQRENELQQVQTKILAIQSEKEIDLVKLHSFNLEVLNVEPDKSMVKVNKLAGNSKYLPIGYVETMLDTIFLGAWSLENVKWQVISNEIVGVGDLVMVHPITGREFKRSGSAAIQIQQTKGAKVDDIGAKIKNALEKGFPKLKAEIVKNAAKSLGKRFGRDLNRGDEYDYDPNELNYLSDSEDIEQLDEKLNNCDDLSELGMLWKSLDKALQQRQAVLKRFGNRKKQLRQKETA